MKENLISVVFIDGPLAGELREIKDCEHFEAIESPIPLPSLELGSQAVMEKIRPIRYRIFRLPFRSYSSSRTEVVEIFLASRQQNAKPLDLLRFLLREFVHKSKELDALKERFGL